MYIRIGTSDGVTHNSDHLRRPDTQESTPESDVLATVDRVGKNMGTPGYLSLPIKGRIRWFSRQHIIWIEAVK